MNAHEVLTNYFENIKLLEQQNHDLWSRLYDAERQLEQLRNTKKPTSQWADFMSYMAEGQEQRTLPEIFEDYMQQTLQKITNRETYKDRCREILDEAETALAHFSDRPDELVNALNAIVGTCQWVLRTK